MDAGNIWTLRDYKDQPGGKFEFNKFYKQIAVAYGLGLRLDLDFFVLRFDGGMKAVNPVYNTKRSISLLYILNSAAILHFICGRISILMPSGYPSEKLKAAQFFDEHCAAFLFYLVSTLNVQRNRY